MPLFAGGCDVVEGDGAVDVVVVVSVMVGTAVDNVDGIAVVVVVWLGVGVVVVVGIAVDNVGGVAVVVVVDKSVDGVGDIIVVGAEVVVDGTPVDVVVVCADAVVGT